MSIRIRRFRHRFHAVGGVAVSHRRGQWRQSPRSIVAGLAFAACLLGAVGHVMWARFASGDRVAELDIQQGHVLALPGLTLSSSGARARTVGPVDLHPAMSPARAVLHLRYSRRPGIGRIGYTVAMRDAAGNLVWEKRGRLGGDDDANLIQTTLAVQTFDVPSPGSYTFDVDLDEGRRATLHGARLELRREVADVTPWVLWVLGIGALASLGVSIASRTPPAGPVDLDEPGSRQAA